MPDWSRRHALHAAAGVLLTAFAGCNDIDSASQSVPRDDRDRVADVTVLKIRNRTGTPMVLRRRDLTTEDEPTDEPPGRRGNIMDHVTEMDSDDERALAFQTDVPGASDLEAFFEATDFESESVYIAQSSIPECYERHLTGVHREGDGVDAQFCRTLRPADVDCSADEHDMVAFAIRLPFHGDDFSSVGGGHSSRCDGPYRRIVEPDTTRTVGDDGGSNR